MNGLRRRQALRIISTTFTYYSCEAELALNLFEVFILSTMNKISEPLNGLYERSPFQEYIEDTQKAVLCPLLRSQHIFRTHLLPGIRPKQHLRSKVLIYLPISLY